MKPGTAIGAQHPGNSLVAKIERDEVPFAESRERQVRNSWIYSRRSLSRHRNAA